MHLNRLVEMSPPVLVSRINHGGVVHSCASLVFIAAGGVDAHVFMHPFQVFRVLGVACTVHGEHPTAISAAKRGVIQVMIKNHDVPGVRLHGNVAGKLRRRDAKQLHGVVHIDFFLAHKMVGSMGTRYEPQSAGVTSEWIEIERRFGSE